MRNNSKTSIFFTLAIVILFATVISGDATGEPPHLQPSDSNENSSIHTTTDTTTSTNNSAISPALAPSSEENTNNDKTDKKAHKKTYRKNELRVDISQHSRNNRLVFNWHKRVSAAVFKRGEYAWIIFGVPKYIDTEYINKNLPKYIVNIEQVASKTHTILRLKLKPRVYVSAINTANHNWIVDISRYRRLPKYRFGTDYRTQADTGKPYLFIQTSDVDDSVKIKDPESEMEMVVVPIFAPNYGFYPQRNFPNVIIHDSAHGIAIEKLGDMDSVNVKDNGVIIYIAGGYSLSKSTPKVNWKKYRERNNDSGVTLFPNNVWRTTSNKEFIRKKHDLMFKISLADNWEANFLRSELAKLYMSSGLYFELIGILDTIKTRLPSLYNDLQLEALYGAANFMSGRFLEAQVNFNHPSLAGNEEIEYWQKIIQMQLGIYADKSDFLKFDDKYAKHYPPAIRQRLAIKSADHEISIGNYNYALKIAKRIKRNIPRGESLNHIQDYLTYIAGRAYTHMGDPEKSRLILEDLLKHTKDRYVEAHAKLTLATNLYLSRKINRKQFIRKLESIRLLWRGDNLELNLLEVLGKMYIADGQYLQGLQTWKDLLTFYPASMQATEIAVKMADTFVELFNGGLADNMKPLDALALYYEFRELTPLGAAGDLMIRNLADRLASIDLLERAAALLEHQIKYRLTQEERSRVGARLALIYLLNKEAEKAVNTLKMTGYGNNDEQLKRQRNILAATAYSELGEIETALRIIEGDFSHEAKMLRLDIHWNNKNWDKVIEVAENILASRHDITSPLNEEEAQVLLRLAIAYTFKNDVIQLNYLKDYFSPLMEGNPLQKSFEFIASDRGKVNKSNIALLGRDIKNIQSFLQTYRKRMLKDGLSKVIE